MTFREYRNGDARALFILDELCFASPFRVSERVLRTSAEAKHSFVLIAQQAGKIAGFVILNTIQTGGEQVSYVTTLDVHPDERGRGLGQRLMEQAEHHARSKHQNAIVLHVFTGNEAAIRLYTRLGYHRSAYAQSFYAEGMDAWVYRKLLGRAGDAAP